jgi:hypothetical protein
VKTVRCVVSAWRQKATKSGGDGEGFPKAPTGTHPARCVAIVDMGTQINEFGGKQTKQRRAYFCWELVEEDIPGRGRTFTIGLDLTVSMNEKATLRKWVEGRVGKQMPDGHEYDISQELGKPCLLSVIEKNNYPKVSGMGALPKGMVVKEASYAPFIWSLDDMPDDGSAPEFPDWLPYLYGTPLVDHVLGCEELKRGVAGVGASPAAGDTDDDSTIPF